MEPKLWVPTLPYEASIYFFRFFYYFTFLPRTLVIHWNHGLTVQHHNPGRFGLPKSPSAVSPRTIIEPSRQNKIHVLMEGGGVRGRRKLKPSIKV